MKRVHQQFGSAKYCNARKVPIIVLRWDLVESNSTVPLLSNFLLIRELVRIYIISLRKQDFKEQRSQLQEHHIPQSNSSYVRFSHV